MNWLAYFAGYFDGEGCITVACADLLTAKITSLDDKVLHMFLKRFGGRICSDNRTGKDGRTREYKRWSVNGNEAVAFLSLVLPWLVAKRKRALIAVKLSYGYNRGRRVPDRERKLRKKLTDLIKRKT